MILNGPNLNMLGKRDTDYYGTESLDKILRFIKDRCPNHEFVSIQSNKEGELIDAIQSIIDSDIEALIANLGGFSHTSVAIRDALELLEIPVIEVHLSNIHAREKYRESSITGAVSNGVITGFGKNSYILGIRAAEELANK